MARLEDFPDKNRVKTIWCGIFLLKEEVLARRGENAVWVKALVAKTGQALIGPFSRGEENLLAAKEGVGSLRHEVIAVEEIDNLCSA